MDNEAIMREENQKRERERKEKLEETGKYASCALIPSPDVLETAQFQGKDVTDTLGDYGNVLDWVKKIEPVNAAFYKEKTKLSEENFKRAIQLAFSTSFSWILPTESLNAEQLVLWYYAGHGLGKPNIDAENLGELSAVPNLEEKAGIKVEARTVKGGELCLHQFGFCDIHGVLKPWIAALKYQSTNINDPKQHVRCNKHFVLILDSCYSGIFANDLKELAQRSYPWNENGCTVTIQASCGAEEPTFGGYFTPLFLHLNKNPEDLDQFTKEWEKLNAQEKESFSSLRLPSPMVATTRKDENDHSLYIRKKCQNFNMVLFSDAAFFKYCFVRKFEKLNSECARALDNNSVKTFLSQSSFTVLDYKLKKTSPHAARYPNTPMGLFLVQDPPDPDYVVCVHIHFPLDDTNIANVSRINLAHHLRPGPGQSIYEEEKPEMKIRISEKTREAKELVKACYDEVENLEPGRWCDHSKWNMQGKVLGIKGLLRLRQHLDQRPQDMNSYLQTLTNTKDPAS